MKISISPGNSKVGKIPSISLPPGKACADGVPCFEKCYAMKAYRMYPNVRKAYNRNYLMLTQHRLEYFGQLNQWIFNHKPKYFRFHVSGDFIDAEHVRRTLETVRRFPGTSFLAFTKSYSLLPEYESLPSNLSLIVSVWNDYGSVIRLCRKAYTFTDGRTPPPGVFECPGHCDECLECFNSGNRPDVW